MTPDEAEEGGDHREREDAPERAGREADSATAEPGAEAVAEDAVEEAEDAAQDAVDAEAADDGAAQDAVKTDDAAQAGAADDAAVDAAAADVDAAQAAVETDDATQAGAADDDAARAASADDDAAAAEGDRDGIAGRDAPENAAAQAEAAREGGTDVEPDPEAEADPEPDPDAEADPAVAPDAEARSVPDDEPDPEPDPETAPDDPDDTDDGDDTGEDDDEDEAEGMPARRRPRLRRLHLHVGIWTLVSIGLLTLFLVLSSMSLTGRVIVLPRWVAESVLERMNAAMPTGRFTLRQVEFGVTPKGRPRLRLVDVGIKDSTGLDLAQVNGVESGFRLAAVLTGRLEPTVVRLDGAQVTLRRLANGTLALSLGQEASTSGSFASVLDAIDQVFTEGVLQGAELVEASDLTITLEDARVGRLWQVTDGHMKLTQTDRFVDTEVSFDVFNQTEELAHTVFSFRSAKDSSEASLAARFQNAAARDIALQSPALAFLSVIDAPISGALRTSVNADGAISELAGTLSIGSGALSPTAGARPARFDGAKVYIDYDPKAQRLDLLGAELASELGTAEGEGHFYLTDFNRGLPNSLVGQVTLTRARLVATDLFEAPLDIDRGLADFRLKLDPFTVDIGQAVAFRGSRRYAAHGTVAADSAGWRISLDADVASADKPEILAVWPVNQNAGLRQWFTEHVRSVSARDSQIAFRKQPGSKLTMEAVYNIASAEVVPIPSLPPFRIDSGYLTQGRNSIALSVDKGSVAAPDGSEMDLAGTTYQVDDLAVRPQIANLKLAMDGPLGGALSLLDLPPFNAFAQADFGPDVARGHASITARAKFPLRPKPLDLPDVDLAVTGKLTDLRSDVLVKDRLLIADSLDLTATNRAVELTGPVRIGRAEARGTWHQPIGAALGEGEKTVITGTLDISDRTLREFDIGLPDSMLTGSAPAQFTLSFPEGAPQLELVSELRGAGLAIPGTGWRKATGTKGALSLTARLGDRPEVESLSISAPGLEAAGRVSTAEGGGLGEARFSRVKLGSWFDGAVTITGRGAAPVGIAITSGTLDMRRADLADGGGSPGARGPKQPLTISLNRLIISEGIRIRGLKGDFDLSGGLRGTFSGVVVGGAPIQGTVAPQGGRSAFRITSKKAGAVLRGAGVFGTLKGGDLELILAPVGDPGTYEGEFSIKGTQMMQTPSAVKLLSAVSIVGLIDQLNGEGISFSEVDGRFRLTPDSVTLYRSSAVGASLGISLDGYYDLKKGQIDMQGVLSPFYLVNVLGRLISPRDGEGLIGFNFDIKGDYDNPEVNVNPLSILTPGAFREIFRRPPPEAPKE